MLVRVPEEELNQMLQIMDEVTSLFYGSSKYTL